MTIYSNRINVIATSRSIPSLHLMITNTQNVSTPVGLQVLATVPLTFGKYSVDFDKIAFYYNGNPVYSWVESVSNGSMNVWLKMPVSISANTSISINAIPYNKTVFDNNYWGCAPTLTNQYGQYDNGASVFKNYWNFAGTSLPSGWTISGTVTINNGIFISGSSLPSQITYTNPIGTSVLDWYGYATVPTGPAFWINLGWYAASGTNAIFTYNGYSTYGFGNADSSGLHITYTNIPATSSQNYIFTIDNDGTNAHYAINYNYQSTTYPMVSSTNTIGFRNGASSSGNGSDVFVQWVRVRAYPPNGVMPSVTVSY